MKKFLFLIYLLLHAATSLGANNVPPGIIEQIDPGRSGEQQAPESLTPSLLGPEIQTPKTPSAPEYKGPKLYIHLHDVKIIGNTVFNEEKLKNTYIKYMDLNVTFVDLQHIAQNITNMYRNAGYILAQAIIPEQEINESQPITIEVYEGYIDEVGVDGTLRPATKKLLMQYAHKISAQKPLKMSNLERFSLLANDLPGLKVRAVLTPSNLNIGAAKLTLQAHEEKNDWYAGANNFNAEVLGREQMVGGIHANSYLPGSQTGVRGVLSFHVSRFKYFALTHKQQLNDDGLGFDSYISNTNTNPNFDSLDLVYLQTPGQAFIFNANVMYPYIRSRKKNLSFTFGCNYLNSHSSYYGTELFNDATRSINAKVNFNILLADQSLNNFEAGIYQGLNIFNAHASPPTIIGGKTNFSKIIASISRFQKLPCENCYLLLWVKGQYSLTKELSSEKFGFGGAPFGYGYDPSVITGDHGYAFKLEPQYNVQLKYHYMPQVQVFGFFDTGTTYNMSGENQPGHQSATSMGGGVRTIVIKRLSVELIVAQPFSVFATNNNKNNTRLMFNIYYTGGTIFG